MFFCKDKNEEKIEKTIQEKNNYLKLIEHELMYRKNNDLIIFEIPSLKNKIERLENELETEKNKSILQIIKERICIYMGY